MIKNFLSIFVATGLIACSSSPKAVQPNISMLQNKTEPLAKQEPVLTNVSVQQNKIAFFEEAASRGMSAATIAKTSHSKEDWQLVASQWSDAIDLMKQVPKSDKKYAVAQGKVTEYQKNLAYAKQQAFSPSNQYAYEPVQSNIEPKIILANSKQPPVNKQGSRPIIAQNVKAQNPVTTPVVTQNKGSSEVNSAREFLKTYLQAAIVEGSDGEEYWCSKTSSLQESLFSPRTYKLLGVQKYGTKNDPSYRFRLTVESSNRGGMPIVRNWSFYVMRETSKARAKSLPSGWCVGMII